MKIEKVKLLSRFAVAGITSTVFAYFSFPIIFNLIMLMAKENKLFELMRYRGVVLNVSYMFALILNVSISFYLQKKVVFRSKRQWLREYIKFWMGALGIVLIGYFVLLWLTNIINLDIFISNAIVVTFSAVLSFLFHYIVTFKGGKNDKN